MKNIVFCTCIFCALFMHRISFAQLPAEFDPAFQEEGFITYDHQGTDNVAVKMILQPDDKALVISYEYYRNGTPSDYTDDTVAAVISRYDADGNTDTGFGDDGYSSLKILQYTFPYDVVVQADGKILMAGYSRTTDVTRDSFFVARYTADGLPDNSFNDDGLWIDGSQNISSADFGLNAWDFEVCINLQDDGKILFGSAVYDTASHEINPFIARLKPDGTYDDAFGGAGYITHALPGSINSYITVIRQRDDGNIVCMGYSSYYGSIIMLKANGSPDTTFSSDGYKEYFDAVNTAKDFVFLPDGKMLALYWFLNFSGGQFYGLVKFKSNGQLDTDFGDEGYEYVFSCGPGSIINVPASLAMQSDGKIIISGKKYEDGNEFETRNFLIKRLNADASEDETFGDDGEVIYAFSEGPDFCSSARAMSDGRIMAAGSVYTDSLQGQDIVLVRLLSGLELSADDLSAENYTPFIYPNPIQTSAHFSYALDGDEKLSLSLINMQGETVQQFFSDENKYSGKNEQQLQFDAALTSGNYLLVLSGKEKKAVIKITIQR